MQNTKEVRHTIYFLLYFFPSKKTKKKLKNCLPLRKLKFCLFRDLLSSLSQVLTFPFQSHVCLSMSNANPLGHVICFRPDLVHLCVKYLIINSFDQEKMTIRSRFDQMKHIYPDLKRNKFLYTSLFLLRRLTLYNIAIWNFRFPVASLSLNVKS